MDKKSAFKVSVRILNKSKYDNNFSDICSVYLKTVEYLNLKSSIMLCLLLV